MIYQPINLSPKNISVDGNNAITFTWKSTGSTYILYQLIIRKNLDDTLVYNSYPVQSNVSSHIVPAFVLTNGIEYKWQVQVWDTEGTAISDWCFLKANTTPVVTFTSPNFEESTIIDTQNYTFVVNYSQLENISAKKYRFILYDLTGTSIIEDTDWIYGVDIQYTIYGMIREQSYKIECQVMSQNDLYATTGQIDFTIGQYILPEGTPELQVTALDSIGAVEINWNTQIALAEVKNSSNNSISPTYTTGKFGYGLQLNSGEKVVYTKPVTTDYSMTFYIKLPYGQNGDFLQFDDGIYMGYNGTLRKFYINNNDTYTYSDEIVLHTWEDWTGTWNTYNGKTFIIAGFNADSFMYNFIFIGMNNYSDFIIKFHGEKRAESI